MAEEHDHHGEHASGLEYKLPSAAGLFLLSFACAYSPFWITKFQSSKLLQSISNALAAGIFLSAAFIHIIPHALEKWKDEPKVANLEFPWIFFISVCSFATLLFVDRVLLSGHSHQTQLLSHQESLPKVEPAEPISNKPCCDEPACEGPMLSLPKSPVVECALPVCAIDHEVEGNLNHRDGVEKHKAPCSADNHKPAQDPAAEKDALKSRSSRDAVALIQTTASHQHGASAGHLDHHQKPNLMGTASVIFSMGFHAIFEGLALGLLADFEGFLGFLAAIVFHKWAESMAIGFNILRNNLTKCQRIVAVTFFACLTPLGVIIGILASSSDNITIGVLLAIAGGTFLYIGIAEIISHEFEGRQHKWVKFLCFLIGVGIMILAWYFESLTHEEDH